MPRPFVYINMAMTADGKITSAGREYPRFTSALDRKTMDRLRAEADAILVGAGTLRADDPPLHVRDPEARAYRESLKAIVGWTVTDRLDQIRCPVLVVAADADYTPVEAKAAYIEKIPRGRMVVVEDSRHGTPVEKPELFNRILREFLLGSNP